MVTAAQAPLAALDFSTGEARNIHVVGERPPVVEREGHSVIDLSIPRASLPMEWSANMPNPGFPGLAEVIKKPVVERPKLVLKIDPEKPESRGPLDLAIVITVYDYCAVNSSSSGTNVSWATSDPKAPTGSGRFGVSGDPFAVDALYRPRLVRKTVVAPGVVLKGAQSGGDLEISPDSQVFIQRVEVYRLPPSPLDDRTTRRAPGMISYPTYLPPRSVLDVWLKDFSDLMVEQAQAYATWADADALARALCHHLTWSCDAKQGSSAREVERQAANLSILVDSAARATDALFYEGKVALIREDQAAYRRLLQAAKQSLTSLSSAAERLQALVQDTNRRAAASDLRRPAEDLARDPSPGRSSSDRPSPLDCVLFVTFSNSPWDYWDPYNAAGRYLAHYGISVKGYLLGGREIDEKGNMTEAAREQLKSAIDQERARGFDVTVGVGHHGFHLTEHGGLPDWLAKKSAPESLYDVNYKGQAQGYMDIWNPHVRQYFHEALTALARETVKNQHVVPWFYFGEPMCASGYSPAARRAFVEYLKDKYGEITRLNTAWESKYAAFEEIQPPPPPGEKLRTQASGLTYEFEKFRRDSFTQWWKEAAAALRKGDPRARLWFEGWGRLDYLLGHGMDQLGLFDASDLCAVHAGGGGDVQRVWGMSLSRYSGTPLLDGETLSYGDYYQGFATLEQLRAASEQHLLSQCWYGARQFMFWTDSIVMSRVYSYSGPQLYDGAYLSPISPSSSALRVVRRKADLYDPIIKATQVVHPQVGILYSSTSFIDSWPYNEVEHETYPIHSWLYNSDFGYLYAHENAIVDGREDLHSFKVLFAPWAMWLQPRAAQALLDWVKNGGVLISSGPVGAFDQYGKPLNTILKAALGDVEVSYAANERVGDTRLSNASRRYLRSVGDTNTTHFGGWAWNIKLLKERPEVKALLSLADDTPVVYEVPLGYGKVVLSTGPIGKNGLRRLAMREVERRVTPLVRKTRDDGFHVLPRIDAHRNLYLGVFNKNVGETITDTLYVDGRYQQVIAKSLLGDCPVPTRVWEGRTAITLTLAPGEATALALGPKMPPSRISREIQYDAPEEPPLVNWSEGDVTRAERQIARGKLEPSARAEAEALLSAANRYASIGYRDRARRLAAQALQTSKPGHVLSVPGDTVVAKRTTAPVKIDGVADEWRNVPRYAVKGSVDEGGEFALQWDAEHLYVLVVARDANLRKVEEQGGDFNWIWNYDGIELVLNTANTAPLTTGGSLYDAKYHATQTALLVSITGRKYANSPGVFSAASVRSAMSEIPGGYVMEVAVPLRDLMLPPIAGANVGLECRIVNNGREMGFGQFSDREGWLFDPLHFARLKLVD